MTGFSPAGLTATQVWTHATRVLTAPIFTEIVDAGVGAGADVTPNVNGIFTARMALVNLQVGIYMDVAGAWANVAIFTTNAINETGKTCLAIVGEANKIRFKNNDVAQQNMVVNRIA